MYLRLDPWAAEYNTAYYADPVSDESRATVDLSVEQAAASWQAVRPDAVPSAWSDLLFIDGSRRLEARVLLEDEGAQRAFGALGTYGVGGVSCCAERGRRAFFLDAFDVSRVCALSGGHRTDDVEVEAGLAAWLGDITYRVHSTEAQEAEAVIQLVQSLMLQAEARLASRLSAVHPDALIICDGPRPLLAEQAQVVGYLKTIHDLKVGREQLEIVCRLEQGQRSPLYLIETADKRHCYFEWFLRLRDPRPWLYSLAGMVRLQAFAGPEPLDRLESVQRLADWSCHNLPHFASRGYQDPRAPQQLLPIRALESELKRRMGNPGLVRRRITHHLAGQGGRP